SNQVCFLESPPGCTRQATTSVVATLSPTLLLLKAVDELFVGLEQVRRPSSAFPTVVPLAPFVLPPFVFTYTCPCGMICGSSFSFLLYIYLSYALWSCATYMGKWSSFFLGYNNSSD
ncbi:unnamed protein product, partial [Ectocarpus sp. 12 AP-2014]